MKRQFTLQRFWLSCLVSYCACGPALSQITQEPTSPASTKDEVEIRSAIGQESHTTANLDWENVFGVRFHSLKQLRTFVETRVAKLSTVTTTNSELETKIHFVQPTVAVVDVYSHLAGQIDQDTGKPGADRWIRNTYVVAKANKQWTVVLQRIADLRSPWYPHLNTFPPAAPIPAAILASYKGTYEARQGEILEVSPEGDHLSVRGQGVTGIAIPRSATEFLYFRDPTDPGNNSFWTFSSAPNGTVALTVSGAQNAHLTVYRHR